MQMGVMIKGYYEIDIHEVDLATATTAGRLKVRSDKCAYQSHGPLTLNALKSGEIRDSKLEA